MMGSSGICAKYLILSFVFLSLIIPAGVTQQIIAQNMELSLYESQAIRLLDKGAYMDGVVIVGKVGEKYPEIIQYKETERIIEDNKDGDFDISDSDNQKKELKDQLVKYLADSQYEYAEPNYLYELSSWTDTGAESFPNDYNAADHWYYKQADLLKLWDKQNCAGGGGKCGGSNDVTVAVIDSGVAIDNVSNKLVYDLFDDVDSSTYMNVNGVSEFSGGKVNVFTNNSEIPANGIDDDNNGFYDDYKGLDLTALKFLEDIDLNGGRRSEGLQTDLYGHGTLVAGNIASATNNGAGSISPAFNLELMPINIGIHFMPFIDTASAAIGITYAADNGADVINMSFGGSSVSTAVTNAVKYADNKDVIMVAATGNSNSIVSYPAAYPQVIAVGAVNSDNTKSSYSSYGSDVDVVAYVGDGNVQGDAVYQTGLGCMNLGCSPSNRNSYSDQGQYVVGTSFASPQVAALAGLIKSEKPSLSSENIKKIITDTATDIGTVGKDNYFGHGVIDWDDWLSHKYVVGEVPTEYNLQPVYRFWSAANQTHFYTISRAEKELIQQSYPSRVWRYEGVAYYASTKSIPNYKPVYRFWSAANQTHFYTISGEEKILIQQNYPTRIWKYEGVAFYTSPKNLEGLDSVNRFWSAANQTHFYTISGIEKQLIANSYPEYVWKLEGIGFYASKDSKFSQ